MTSTFSPVPYRSSVVPHSTHSNSRMVFPPVVVLLEPSRGFHESELSKVAAPTIVCGSGDKIDHFGSFKFIERVLVQTVVSLPMD